MTGRKIAVIGSGVSGMTAGYVLSHINYVTLFEAGSRLGGHADTHMVVPPAGPPIGIDTGFIVYNERTYPLLTRMFAELGVATQPGEMSMSVRCAGCGLQYAGQRGLGGLTPGLRRGRGRYLRMLAEIPRFHRAARRLLADGTGANLTLGQFLEDGRFSGYFTAHFALPLVAAVWSCPPGTALSYPARYLFAFLANHGMLAVTGSPPWRTVTGGSRCYVERAAKRLHDIRLCAPVRAVRRHSDGVEVRDATDQTHRFDAVVIATHPDQALRLLDPPTQAERDVLGAFSYTRNPTVLHTDVTLLPGRPGIRASWNYELGGCWPGEGGPAPRISYHMNRLQNLPTGEEYIVCHRADGTLACVVAEVHNTYGQRHAYLLHTDHRGRAQVPKEFYVSPFYPVDGRYRMSLPEPDSRLALSIVLGRPDGHSFAASVHGRGVPATARALIGAAVRHPWSTAAVSARIRWQGVKLYLRGLRPVPRPAHLPQEGVQ